MRVKHFVHDPNDFCDLEGVFKPGEEMSESFNIDDQVEFEDVLANSSILPQVHVLQDELANSSMLPPADDFEDDLAKSSSLPCGDGFGKDLANYLQNELTPRTAVSPLMENASVDV